MEKITFIEDVGPMPTRKQMRECKKKIQPLIEREFHELPNGNTITYLKAKPSNHNEQKTV
jgi:hypothetical protein